MLGVAVFALAGHGSAWAQNAAPSAPGFEEIEMNVTGGASVPPNDPLMTPAQAAQSQAAPAAADAAGAVTPPVVQPSHPMTGQIGIVPGVDATGAQPQAAGMQPPVAGIQPPLASDNALPQAQGMDLSREPGFDLPVGSDAAGVPGAEEPKLSPKELEAKIRQEAFEAAYNGFMPLHPDEIREFYRRYDRVKEAVQTPVYEYPEPEITVQTISLDPSVKPPVINVAVGHVTTLNLLDVTGAPWPIQDVSWAGNFTVVEPEEEGDHIIHISPMADFAHGNMSLRVLNLPTPITFTLKTVRDKVAYRFDARLPEPGPFAKPSLIEGGISVEAGDSLLMSVLEGVPPAEAKKMEVTGVDGRTTAYKVGDMTYVRTPMALLSPGWGSSVRSAEGLYVYALNNAPVLLLSDKGRVVRARVSEPSDDVVIEEGSK